MDGIDRLLSGSIDMHLHVGPNITPCRIDALEAAQQAKQAGMRAIVLKQPFYPTAPVATIVNRMVPGIEVFGSICLDFELGGLNYHAMETSGKLGAKVVWMPTFSSSNSRAVMNKMISAKIGLQLEGEGFSLLDNRGELVPELAKILSIAKKYDMVVATGHISPAETFVLIDEAQKIGIKKFVITHPNGIEVLENALTLDEQKQLAQKGAFIELIGFDILPNTFHRNRADTTETIKFIGPEHCIISTDSGQSSNPLPTECMRMFISYLLWNGLSEKEIELMAKVNPSRLLGLN